MKQIQGQKRKRRICLQSALYMLPDVFMSLRNYIIGAPSLPDFRCLRSSAKLRNWEVSIIGMKKHVSEWRKRPEISFKECFFKCCRLTHGSGSLGTWKVQRMLGSWQKKEGSTQYENNLQNLVVWRTNFWKWKDIKFHGKIDFLFFSKWKFPELEAH